MTIGERIKQKRLELGYSVDKLAEILGKNRATIYRYENNEIENLPINTLEPLAKALKTTPAYLMNWEDTIKEDMRNVYDQYIDAINSGLDVRALSDDEVVLDNVRPITVRKFPLLGEIACGKPVFTNEDRESYVVAGTNINADFCLTAKGDSMTGARIYDGDIVFIKSQSEVSNGEIAAVIIDNEATLKRVYYDKEKNFINLVSENPVYPPMVYSGTDLDSVYILGKAVAFQSDVI